MAGALQLEAAAPALEAAYDFWTAFSWEWIMIGHCLYCSTLVPSFKDRFALHFLVRARDWARNCLRAARALLQQPQPVTRAHHLSFCTDNLPVGFWWRHAHVGAHHGARAVLRRGGANRAAAASSCRRA